MALSIPGGTTRSAKAEFHPTKLINPDRVDLTPTKGDFHATGKNEIPNTFVLLYYSLLPAHFVIIMLVTFPMARY